MRADTFGAWLARALFWGRAARQGARQSALLRAELAFAARMREEGWRPLPRSLPPPCAPVEMIDERRAASHFSVLAAQREGRDVSRSWWRHA